MRVLFISRKFPPSVGGMEQFAYDLSQALAARVNLKLVAWGGHGRLRAVLVAIPNLFIRSFTALAKGGTDIIHVNDGVMAPAGYILSRLFRQPFTVVIHGLDITYGNPLFKAVVPWAVRRAAAVFCISEASAIAARRQGIPDSKIHVINLAVNDDLRGRSTRPELLKKLELTDDNKILLTVGRLVERKGVAWFITDVLPGLVKSYPKLVYVVVGEGVERGNIETAVAETGLEVHVRLLGRVTDDLYQAAYNGADVFVMPNVVVAGDMEGFGLVVLEAALCGLPVVAADLEGIRDAVTDGENGQLVPDRDAAAFAGAISRYLDDPKSARQAGEKARRYTLAHYQWDNIARRYAAVYEQVLGK
jgi:glycosyltransferase involved in cell wall biosynthesis